MLKKIDHLAQWGRAIENALQTTDLLQRAEARNPWWVTPFTRYALQSITGHLLQPHLLQAWLQPYPVKPVNKTVALIFAGNVPLVGLHDFICCYIAGCHIKIKLSGKDDELFPALLKLLAEIDPEVNNRVELTETLQGFDAVIATGSNNTNRYFEYYFRQYPKILRAHRNSVAVLTGNETAEELQALADDIFLYFGFGCRNVSKLYVPADYAVSTLFPHFKNYAWLHQHGKYMSNYDYNRTVLLMNKTTHYADEVVMLVEDVRIASPIATVHYEYWHDENILASRLRQQRDQIQCIVSSAPGKWGGVSEATFGQAQQPALNDYADGADTLRFLFGL